MTGTVVLESSLTPGARLLPVALQAVRFRGGFWEARVDLVRQVTLRQQHDQLEATGRIANFHRAAGAIGGDFNGRYYNDSDVYKWVEAASFSLATHPDPELEHRLESVVSAIASAQQPDGYLNTYFMFDLAADRWADLTNKHEMYCAGHLIQAAIAHHRATGRRTLLDVSIRLADHICTTFGPTARRGTDGHQEIELAMVELFRETRDRRYLDEAVFLLEMRGQQPPVVGGSPYHQDHLPVREQSEAVGHAVRLTYLACALADVAMETGDKGFGVAAHALWASAFERKAYVTGGLGARWQGEAFGEDYELPNDTAYAETCAAIGGFMWSWRLLIETGEARFAEAMETALYNGILAGVSLDGEAYFYQNPLSDRGRHRRQPWFGTACCPPNIARLLMSLPGYLASVSDKALHLHTYASALIDVIVPGAGRLQCAVETAYPWDGTVTIDVLDAPDVPVTLHLRIPSWAEGASVAVGALVAEDVPVGEYWAVTRRFASGDRIVLDLPMRTRLIEAHPRVASNAGRVALVRGPVVHCVEAADHPGVEVSSLAIDPQAGWDVNSLEGLPGCPHALVGVGATRGDSGPTAPLHRTRAPKDWRAAMVTAVPYFAWANREAGAMAVWLPVMQPD